ncbi:9751_t:CDS:10 [Diversispora eburnea]|uniref:9751_t:CDS:1 n=1 Tax=Diversispora eburnea TaxID=1213867 RepID=A0A9N9FT35_9GLOM|nr:9751_t:CDS:10 [Diversispora eburnea]
MITFNNLLQKVLSPRGMDKLKIKYDDVRKLKTYYEIFCPVTKVSDVQDYILKTDTKSTHWEFHSETIEMARKVYEFAQSQTFTNFYNKHLNEVVGMLTVEDITKTILTKALEGFAQLCKQYKGQDWEKLKCTDVVSLWKDVTNVELELKLMENYVVLDKRQKHFENLVKTLKQLASVPNWVVRLEQISTTIEIFNVPHEKDHWLIKSRRILQDDILTLGNLNNFFAKINDTRWPLILIKELSEASDFLEFLKSIAEHDIKNLINSYNAVDFNDERLNQEDIASLIQVQQLLLQLMKRAKEEDISIIKFLVYLASVNTDNPTLISKISLCQKKIRPYSLTYLRGCALLIAKPTFAVNIRMDANEEEQIARAQIMDEFVRQVNLVHEICNVGSQLIQVDHSGYRQYKKSISDNNKMNELTELLKSLTKDLKQWENIKIFSDLKGRSIKKFDYNTFKDIALITNGEFGIIYCADSTNLGKHVVLKSFYADDNKFFYEKFVRKLTDVVSVTNHDNVINFYGISIVKINMAKDLARGLHFIHQANIVHGDLVNFVSSRSLYSDSNSIIGGMFAYTDPEYLLNPRKYKINKASDVYSVGVLFWELSSGRPAFYNFTDIQIIKLVTSDEREKPIKGTPWNYINIYSCAWHCNPTERPTIEDIYISSKFKNNEKFGNNEFESDPVSSDSSIEDQGEASTSHNFNEHEWFYDTLKNNDATLMDEKMAKMKVALKFIVVVDSIKLFVNEIFLQILINYFSKDCWKQEPDQRPNIDKVIQDLEKLINRYN